MFTPELLFTNIIHTYELNQKRIQKAHSKYGKKLYLYTSATETD